MKNIIFPKTLKKGDQIAIISPAGFVEEASLQNTINLIKSKSLYQKLVQGMIHIHTKLFLNQLLHYQNQFAPKPT
jgi:muramoyltetrapeptide carboxypeptidase LdcA involved in peptidoglycan recycling